MNPIRLFFATVILLEGLSAGIANAQHPNGAAGGEVLWLRADTLVNVGSTTATWKDLANGLTLGLSSKPGTIVPSIDSSFVNFNPSLLFNGTSNLVAAPFNQNTLFGSVLTLSNFVVYVKKGTNGNNFLKIGATGVGGGTWNFAVAPGTVNITGSVTGQTSPGTGVPADYTVIKQSGTAASGLVNSDYNGVAQYPPVNNSSIRTGTDSLYIGGDGVNFGNVSICEEIAYPSDQTANKLQIQSYLALKYGITMSQTTATNYLAGDGNTKVWNAATAGGFKQNIFGIGRDALSGLDQRVSISSNAKSIVTVATTNNFVLASHDVSRTALTAGQYLTIADSNTTAVPTWVALTSYMNLLNDQWQVQNTGGVGGVYLQFNVNNSNYTVPALPAGSKYYLVYDNSGTISANSTIVPLTSTGTNLWGTTSAISFSSKAVFTLATVFTVPGGVAGATVWLKADAGILPIGGSSAITSWTDQASGVAFTNANVGFGGPPSSTWATINFNPAISFTGGVNNAGTLASASGDIPETNILGGTLPANILNSHFIVYRNYSPLAGRAIDWYGVSAADIGSLQNTQMIVAGVGGPGSSTAIGITSTTTNSTTFTSYFNGVSYGTATTGTSFAGNSKFYIGNNSTHTLYAVADIAEIINYNIDVTQTSANARQQIESYLATKWGITLSHDYISPTAGTYYSTTTTNSAYTNDITVIGKEGGQGLDQEESFSTSSTFPIYIGAGNTIAATNAAHASSLANNTYEAIGNNGLSTAISTINTSNLSATNGGGLCMARVWKVQETGTVSAVMIAVPSSAFSASPCNSFLVVNSTDPTFASGNTIVSSSGTQTVNGIVCTTFNVDFITGQYFTFSQNITAPPGTVPNGSSVSAVPVATCSDAFSYNAFVDNAATPTKKYLAINANGNNLSAVTVAVSNNNSDAAIVDAGNDATALSSNMYTIDDGSNGATIYTNSMKVRVYFNPADTLAAWNNVNTATANPPSIVKSLWFKFEGTATAAQTAQFSNGIAGASFFTPTYGTEGGVNYAEFSGITNFSTFGYVAYNSLSILGKSLENFKGTRQGSNNMLQWTVGDAVNFRQFQLQRSGTSGGSFATVATIAFANGQSNYSYIDPNISANGYYRLALVNDDGTLSYSNVVYIAAGVAAQSIKVSPNPTASGSMVTITLTGYTGRATGRLYDGAGKVVSIISRLTNGNNTLSTATLAKGVYYVIVTDTNGNTCTEKIVVR